MYVKITDRSASDDNASADIDQLQANIEALKGGDGATPPPFSIVEIVAQLGGAGINVRSAESGDIADLTVSDKTLQIYSLSGNANQNIASSGIKEGQKFTFRNPGAYALIIKSENDDVLETFVNADLVIMALQDDPTDFEHWYIERCQSLTKEKTYNAMVAYKNGTPTLTNSADPGTLYDSQLIVTQSIDGQHYLEVHMEIGHQSVGLASLTLSGVNITTQNVRPGQAYNANAVNLSNSGANLEIDVYYSSAYTFLSLFFKTPIVAKPAWAD